MNPSIVRRGTVFALALSSLTGCFKYTPMEAAAIPDGEAVRVYVDREVVESIGEVTTSTSPVLRGRISRREPGTLFLRIPIAVRREGFHSAEIGQDVSIPFEDIISIERRSLDRIGTGALVASTAGAVAVVLFVIMEAFGERELDECTDCEDLLTPLLRIPLR